MSARGLALIISASAQVNLSPTRPNNEGMLAG